MKKNKKNKNGRNLEIKLMAGFFMLVFFLMIGNLVYFLTIESDTAINNNYNKRQDLLAQTNVRGKILANNGEILAQTATDESGEEKRYYPYGNLFAHVVGYSTNGKMGVESISNISLLTSNAFVGEKIQNEIDAQKNIGDNVITTLDVDLQQVAYEALGVYDGSVIVTEPKTGKILAMVSKPDFDPNKIDQEWDTIISDKNSSVLLNRATQGLYPPGSTFKIVSALEFFREKNGVVDDYTYQCNGRFVNGTDVINCYHKTSHGSVNFMESFEKSCNSSFANIGLTLDRNKWAKTCDELLFNEDLPLQLTSNKSSYVLSDTDSEYEVMQTAIGQGETQITPIHLNMISMAIANNGNLMKPYVVSGIENYKGTTVETTTEKKVATLMTQDEATFLKTLMEGVVLNGTASKLDGLSYTAAGKTGSAEFSSVKEDSHAWFTGFAPVEEPEICITVILEGAGSGGDYAVPIAKRIFDAYFSK